MFKWLRKKNDTAAEAREYVKVGFEARQSGDWASARVAFEAALRIDPSNADAHYLLGLLALSDKAIDQALEHIDRAIALDPTTAAFHASRAEALNAKGDLTGAASSLEAALARDDQEAGLWHHLGDLLGRLARVPEAIDVFRRAIERFPDEPTLHWKLGMLLIATGDEAAGRTALRAAWAVALRTRDASFRFLSHLFAAYPHDDLDARSRELLATDARHVGAASTAALLMLMRGDAAGAVSLLRDASGNAEPGNFVWTQLAAALRVAGQLDEAIEVHRKAVSVAAACAFDFMEFGTTLKAAGNLPEAEVQLNHAVTLAPDNADAAYLLADVLKMQGATDEAEVLYRQANTLAGGHASALLDLSDILIKRGRHREASEVLFTLVALRPKMAGAHLNLGVALVGLKQTAHAVDKLKRALELDPDLRVAHVNLSNIYNSDGRPTAAEEEARAALADKPDDPSALLCLANALQSQGEFAESIPALRRIIALEPDSRVAWSNLLFGLNYLQDITPEALDAEHRRFGEQFTPAQPRTRGAFLRDRNPDRKLRIGYVSPDFRGHVVGLFVKPVFEAHDRSRVEVYCYFTHTESDAMTPQFRELADIWRDASGLTDDEVERMVLADDIDILVDLAGHTGSNRLPAMARRLAPVQVTWLGYPHGTGVAAMDWRITDDRADPAPVADAHHVERLYRMPNTFLVYSPITNAPEVTPPPSTKSGCVTFGSYNNYQKVTDRTLRLWKRILDGVPGSRLVMKTMAMGDEGLQAQVRARLDGLGIPADRVQLLGPVASYIDHLASLANVDIALDTFPYNGTTTTCEALLMGVPVIGLVGDRHASRVTVSLLDALGLDELLATNEDDYVTKAVALAGDPGRLVRLREEIRPRLMKSRLVDMQRFVTHLETAYRSMWKDWLDATRDGHA